MGLLLSILVFSVGVLEALACVRHIQQGILPAWAPRHVTSSSGRRLLREHWRKSTSLDDGSGGGLGPSGDAGALPNGAPSRRPPGERKGSLDEEQAGRPRPPPLTLSESPHHVRSPDIHWPEPVPHSPAKHIEQTLPSPVAEVPADAPTWPADAALTPLLQRRRTSTSETLPHEEHGQAEPLRAAASAAPPPSFAREAREPPRNKPAKASSFEEAGVQAFAPPPPKAPEVASVNHHAPAPRAALVHSIEVTSSALNSLDDAPAPWPIVNIDTVATSDEEGDVSPTSNLASRRVSFDPVPTVVVIDNERPITEERERGTILAPSIRITDDLESVLRKELPSVIDDIIQEALVKVNEVLESRQNGPLNGVSLLIENLVSKGDQVLKGPMSSASAEEYKDRFEPTVQSIIELQKDKDVVLSTIPQENKLGRSKEEIGALPNGHPTLLKNEETPSTGLQKSRPRENEAQISNATADQISPSAPAKDGYANTLQFAPAPSEEPNSEIEFGKDVLLDNSKLGNLSASSEPASQTNVQNSIQDAKKRLGNSEELIPESVSGSENKTNDETGGISNCVAEPPVIPNKTKSAPNSTQSLHDTTNENEAVENEIRNEMQGDDGSEERVPETTWKLQSPTAGESLILGDAAVAAAAPVPAESGSIASAPASSAALPPSESRENAAPVPLASATESPVASAAPHIPSDAPESPVAPDSTSESIPLDTVFPDQAIPNNAPESSSPTEDISASSTFPSPNVSIALDSPAASAAPEVHVAPAAPAAPSTPVAPAAPAAAVALASPNVPAAAVASIAPSVPAVPTTPPAAVVPPTSPAAPSTPNAPATPAASAVLPAPIPEAPFSSVASAVPAASAVVAPASPVAPAASVAPTSPAAPVAPSPIAPAASAAPAASVAPVPPSPIAPAASAAPAASVAPTSPAAPVSPSPIAPAASAAPAASVAPTSPAAPVPPSPVAPAASPAPAASIAPTSPAAAAAPVAPSPVAPAASIAPTSSAAAPVAPSPAASVAPTSPAAAAAPVAPSPVAPAASPAPAASVVPTSPAAAAAHVAPSPVAPAASPAPAASVAPTSPAAAAAPVAPSPPSPAVPVPAPGSSKARPASAAPQPPAPAPAVGAPLKEEEPSRAPSSSGRPAGGSRAAAPAAPKAPEALAAPAPQPGAFWVSDASSSPAPHAHTPSPQPTFTATKKPTPVSQPPPPKAPSAPWTQKTPSAGSTKPFRGFQKSVPAESAKTPQSPVFAKAASLSKTPPSPTFVKKQFGAPAPTPVASFPLKQTSSPFGTKVTSSAPPPFYKPAAASTTPAFLTNLTPKASSAFNSRFSDSSPPVSEPIPRPPSPAPAPPAEKREESSSKTPPSPSPSSDPAPRPAPTPAPACSRPTSPPPRDPQDVVRRLAELRRTNPTVATEVLLSILGFKFPGS